MNSAWWSRAALAALLVTPMAAQATLPSPIHSGAPAAEGETHVYPMHPSTGTDWVITADTMKYNGTDGEVAAIGNTVARYDTAQFVTPRLLGNHKTEVYHLPDDVAWTDGARQIDLAVRDLEYNAMEDTAAFANAKGYYSRLYIEAGRGAFSQGANTGILQEAMVTTPSAVAETPDYRIEAETITIIPQESLLAEDVNFYIKNKRIFHLPRYRVNMEPGRSSSVASFLPRPSYKAHNGFGFKAKMEYPLSQRTEAFFNYAWYTKIGFKPDIGVRYYAPYGEWKIHYSKEESRLNDESVWIKKRPELIFTSRPYHFGARPIYARAQLDWGDWKEGATSGSHSGYSLLLATDPLRLSERAELTLATGYWKDFYGYGDMDRSNFYYGARLDYDAGRTQWWTGAQINRLSGETPYRFDRLDLEQPAFVGFKYKVDRLNALGAEYTWDLVNGDLKHADYTWYRDMHSLAGTLTYRAKDDEWRLDVWAKDF